MRITRPVVCLAVTASLLGTGVAGAAVKKPVAKPVCNLVTDPGADTALPDDGMDILGGDVASDAKSFTAVIRLKSVKSTGLGELGRDLQMTFDLPGAEAPVWIGYTTSAYGGDAFQYGLIGKGDAGATSPTGDAVGIIDTAKNEIRMTVPVSALNALGKAKPGAKVSNIAIAASQLVGIAPNPLDTYAFESFAIDDAAGSKAYVAGQASCVKPGK
jgi:hypothetical protein